MTSHSVRRSRRGATEPGLPYEDWLVERLKDPAEAAAYLEAAIEQGHQEALMLALRNVAMARGGIAAVARHARLTREAAYRILSKAGNPELRSLNAILAAAGLRLSVMPIDKPPSVARKPARYRASKKSTDSDNPPWREEMLGPPVVRRGRGPRKAPTKILPSVRLRPKTG